VPLMEGFGYRAGIVRVEPNRNLLLLLGNSTERKTAQETALSFDSDWMKNQLVAIVSLSDSAPDSVVPELERVFNSGEGGASAGVIQFTAMPQQKAILVVSKQRDLIDRARTWIKRLDLRNPDAEAGVYVYRVKYGDAKYLSEIVTQVFSGSQKGAKDQASQTEPGTRATTLSADAADAGGSGDGTQDAAPQDATDAAPAAPGAEPNEAGAKVSVSPDIANNSIVIYADRSMQRKVLAVLRQIDTPSLQVAINVTMAEVKLTRELSNGVQYFLKSKTVGLGTDDGSFGLFGDAANTISRVVPGFNFVIGSDKNPDVIISAFSKLSDVRILSSPSLVVLDNQVAKLQVGDTVPITTRQAQSVDDSTAPIVNSIDYVDTGIILNVKPRIADNGVVQLRIEQEISAVASGSDSLTPTISKRKVSSTISVNDGQTVLLGGLISQQSDSAHGGIPGLFRLKGIGNLFGQKETNGNRNELIILIQPSIIRHGVDAQDVVQNLRSKMQVLDKLSRDP
jgi:general secretion pathway protein D